MVSSASFDCCSQVAKALVYDWGFLLYKDVSDRGLAWAHLLF
ncbi:hypothetical protein [Leptolyngbya iicbica]|nr:hypothetical protein [Leptolyngbya sp. LK]